MSQHQGENIRPGKMVKTKEGQKWKTVQALGAPLLGEVYDKVEIKIAKEFVDAHPEVEEQTNGLDRPAGKMLLLFGQDSLPLFPREIMESACERQRLRKSKLTGRYLVEGLPDIENKNNRTDSHFENTKVFEEH